MATITSTAAGNWSAGGTWVGGIAPTIGDDAVLLHAVTADSATTVGVSGAAGTDAIQIGASGSLTINAGITLTVRGCITATAASRTVTLAAGASLIFDSSSAAGTPVYELRSNGSVDGLKLITSGTSGSRCTIDKAVGSGNWFFNRNGTFDTAAELSYTDVKNCRNAADTRSFDLYLSSGVGRGISLDHVIFDTTAMMQLSGAVDSNWSSSNVTWVNTVGQYCIRPYVGGNATGNRIWSYCVFDKEFFSDQNSHNFNIQNCQFYALVTLRGGGTALAAWANNFVAPSSGTHCVDTQLKGTYLDSYLLANATNPHYWNLYDSGTTGTATVDGFLFENLSTDDQGDACLADASAYTVATTIRAVRNIVLPNSGGTSSGSPLTVARKDDNLTVSMEHCTYHHGGINTESKGCVLFEQGASDSYGHAGLVEYFRDNLSWDTSAGRGWLVRADFNYTSAISGTSTGGNTSTTLNNSGLSMPTNRFAGFGIYIVSGTGASQARIVASNTGTQFTISSAWTTTPDTTSVYRAYVLDLFTAAPNYNGSYNSSAGNCKDVNYTDISPDGNRYNNYNITSGTLYGANDLHTDPVFVDSTRDIATWDTSLGGAGTAANAIAELKKLNNASGYNSAYNLPALLTYVRAGFMPTTVAYRTGGHDGSTIGAVAYVAGGTTGTVAAALASFSPSLTGTTAIIGSVANTLSAFTSSIAGTPVLQGTMAGTLNNFTGAFQGAPTILGSISSTLGSFVSAVQGATTIVGSMASTLSAFIGNFFDVLADLLVFSYRPIIRPRRR